MVHGDRWAARAAQAFLVTAATATVTLCAACGENRPPLPAAPHSAPARDVVIRTGRFALHANAYVSFYAWSAPEDGGPLDADLVATLGRCSDDPCAHAALAGVRDRGELDRFLQDLWPAHADETRRTLAQTGNPILDYEDTLSSALASQVGVVWPPGQTTLFVARANASPPGGRDGTVIDAHGECFEGFALLECLFTRALEDLLPASDLGKGIARARAALPKGDQALTKSVEPCLVAMAVDTALAAADRRYRPTRRFAEACPTGARRWLEDAWARRLRKEEDAGALGEEAVAAWVKLGGAGVAPDRTPR